MLTAGSFNSRPHKEVDGLPGGSRGIRDLSIHDLTRRSTTEEREHPEIKQLSIHDLTRRSTCTFEAYSPYTMLSIHDLTRRSTRTPICCRRYSAPFNSRPHKEVDTVATGRVPVKDLSIHDLTRRSTLCSEPLFDGADLSIHDLTRRSTKR